ncbi:GNAT family N-acetyltransferase [Streptomyces sp. NPDC004647]|uniref:GNAT family N-acetyltransferase n=1 Tax=Streptomyces sp. NPDC004647 TaxID=3154671 RepID=UPI0033A0B6F1
MILEPLPIPDDGRQELHGPHGLPAPLLDELTALYRSDPVFQRISGDFPDPDDIRPEHVAASLSAELAHPSAEVLLAREGHRLLGVAITLAEHPDPDDPDPWIGMLMVHGQEQRTGYGREMARLVEERLRDEGAAGVRLAVLENNPRALAFWTALGYEVIDRREDRRLHRPCVVLRKALGATD